MNAAGGNPMSDAVYYEKPVLLDRDKHRDRKVRPTASFGFARKANSLYLAGVEFNEACKEYAIVFTRVGGRTVPVAMLGLRSRENLFVDDEGKWGASYIPAFVRRYPFVLAELPGRTDMAVCVDEAFEGLNPVDGEPLFDAAGGNTAFLQNALDFLGRYQAEYRRTEAFCRRLEQAGLLMEMNAKADLVDGRSFTINGLMVVDEKKLLALPDAAALALFRSGESHLVSMHLASLSNMQKLVDRMAARRSPLEPAPRPS
jgi:hypothetical protein